MSESVSEGVIEGVSESSECVCRLNKKKESLLYTLHTSNSQFINTVFFYWTSSIV